MAKEIFRVKTFRATDSFWRRLEQWKKKHAPAATFSNVIREFILAGMKK